MYRPHPSSLVARLAAAGIAVSLTTSPLLGQSLRGGKDSVERMYLQAKREGLHFYQTSDGVQRSAQKGVFVRLSGNADYELGSVTFPYARKEAALFVERLAAQYRAACGEKLVVTSAMRPEAFQARLHNGSDKSVHPTGIAIDLRKPTNGRCLSWLRNILVDLERADVIEATEEHRPPHFHIAVFPSPYRHYVRSLGGSTRSSSKNAPTKAATRTENAKTTSEAPKATDAPQPRTYTVRSGDNLWTIARRNNVTVDALMAANQMGSGHLLPGEKLTIPSQTAATATPPSKTAPETTYRVRSGDSLWEIARKHQVSVEDIKKANALKSDQVTAGRTLRIPSSR